MRQIKTKNILWVIYSIPIIIIGILSVNRAFYLFDIQLLTSNVIYVFRLIDLILSLIALVPLILLILEYPTLTGKIWFLFGLLYVSWDFGFNLVLKPIVLGHTFEWYVLIFPILYILVLRTYLTTIWSGRN